MSQRREDSPEGKGPSGHELPPWCSLVALSGVFAGAANSRRWRPAIDTAMSDRSFDLIVVGSGPGGYVAAIRASQLGMKAAVANRGDGVAATLRLAGGETLAIDVDRVIVAVGIAGNVEDLGLETTAVRVDAGHIVANEWMETDEPGIYAVGDVAGPPWLAHKASHEGVRCVEKIAGVPGVQPADVSRIPACTYSRPQLASVGPH